MVSRWALETLLLSELSADARSGRNRSGSLTIGSGSAAPAVDTRRREDHLPASALLDLDGLLDQLASADPRAAELVQLRFFAGLTGDQAAEVLGIAPRSADLLWAYARAWLFEKLQGGSG
jgi:DNA-directed RNA polymerase specialized sigma24 family protein